MRHAYGRYGIPEKYLLQVDYFLTTAALGHRLTVIALSGRHAALASDQPRPALMPTPTAQTMLTNIAACCPTLSALVPQLPLHLWT